MSGCHRDRKASRVCGYQLGRFPVQKGVTEPLDNISHALSSVAAFLGAEGCLTNAAKICYLNFSSR